MDNVKLMSAGMGKAIMDFNTDEDGESFCNGFTQMTVDDCIELLMSWPKKMRELTIGTLMGVSAELIPLEEVIAQIGFDDMSDEEKQGFIQSMEKAFG